MRRKGNNTFVPYLGSRKKFMVSAFSVPSPFPLCLTNFYHGDHNEGTENTEFVKRKKVECGFTAAYYSANAAPGPRPATWSARAISRIYWRYACG